MKFHGWEEAMLKPEPGLVGSRLGSPVSDTKTHAKMACARANQEGVTSRALPS